MSRLLGIGPVLLLSVAVVASAVIGFDLGRGPSLIYPVPINSGGVGVARAHLGDRWSIGMESTFCLDKPGKVRLTGVEPMHPLGLKVIGFAVRPNQSWRPTQGTPGDFLGEVRAPLERHGFTSRTVDVACEGSTPKGYELAVRVLKTTPGPAYALGWQVSYRADGATAQPHHTGRLVIPFGLLLCPANSADAKSCQSLGS
jgi:hypothetical protein